MGKIRRVTIQDVARTAGVSVTSVSNVLNDRVGEMRGETRQRITSAIKELGYTPNSAARQLKTGHAPIIGLMAPSILNPYYAELAVAVDAVAQKKGFRVVLCNTERDQSRELAYVQELVACGIRGIIAASVPENFAIIRDLIKRGIAFVLFETPADPTGFDRVDVVLMNNSLATAKAVDYLTDLGHSTIAFVTATPLTPHRMSRLEGFRTAMARYGTAKTAIVITDEEIAGQSTLHSDAELAQLGQEAAKHLLDLPARPTAVIAMNDMIALGMMSGFQKLGVGIPEDMSIVGIDDIQFASFSSPALTTVRQPYSQIAETAIERLCARLADPNRTIATVSLDPMLICRSSTAKPRA